MPLPCVMTPVMSHYYYVIIMAWFVDFVWNGQKSKKRLWIGPFLKLDLNEINLTCFLSLWPKLVFLTGPIDFLQLRQVIIPYQVSYKEFKLWTFLQPLKIQKSKLQRETACPLGIKPWQNFLNFKLWFFQSPNPKTKLTSDD